MKRAFLLIAAILATAGLQAQTTLLAEGFNVTSRTATPPSGWTVNSSGTGTNDGGSCSSATTWEQCPTGGFSANCGSPGNPLPSSYTGSGMMGYNAWSIMTPSASELVTPALNFSSAGTYVLSVWIYQELNYNPGDDSLRIFVNTSPTSAGANSTMLWEGTPSYSTNSYWTNYQFNIPTTYTGTTNYIIFRGVTNYRNDIFFDSVTVIHNPPTPCNAAPLQPVITTPAMSANAPLCAGSTKTFTATDPNFPTVGNFTYQWQSASSSTGPWTTVSSVTTITGGTLSYTTSSLSTTTWYRLNMVCNTTSNATASTPYQVFVGAPQPGAIAGNASFCPGDVTTYSVPASTGTSYAWTIPSGWTGSSTTNSITVTPGTTGGTMSVTATNACGTSIPQTKSIVAGTAPQMPAAISGNNSPCATTNQTYTTAGSSTAVSYSWTVPTGWSISSTSNGGKSMTAVAGYNSGTITVTAVNGCGSNARTYAVSVITSLDTPGAISGPAAPCAGAQYTYTVPPVTGAATYVWSLPSGWSGTNTGTTIHVFAGSSGTLSVTAYSPCATSPVSGKTITVQPAVTPTVSVSSASNPVCKGVLTTLSASYANGGSNPVFIWKKNGTVMLASTAQFVDNTFNNGDVITASLISDATCRTADTVVSAPLTLTVANRAVPGISINSVPVVTICQGTPLYFNTTANNGGTTPKYQWYLNGIAISGATAATYSTSTSANNDSISVSMTSNAVCATDSIAGSNKVGIIVKPLISPTVSVSASSTQPSPGMPITFTAMVTGGGPTPTFQWILNNVEIAGATNQTYVSSDLIAGDRVMVRMQSYAECANPSVVTSDEVLMQNPTGVGAQSNWQGALAVYPNPSTGRFTIAAEAASLKPGEQLRIEVMSLVGQRVFEKELTAGAGANGLWKAEVELGSQLAAGQYMLRLSTQSGMSAVLPISLQR